MSNQAKASYAGGSVNLTWDAVTPENDLYVSCGFGLTASARAALVAGGDGSQALDITIVNDTFGYSQLFTLLLWNDTGTIKWAFYSDFLGGTFGYITTNHTEADVFHLVEMASVFGVGLKVRIDGDDYGTFLADVLTPNAVLARWGPYSSPVDGDYYLEDVKIGTTAYGSSDLFTSTFPSFTGFFSSSAVAPATLTLVTDEFGGGGAVATAATDVSATQATFNGTVNPGGVATTAYFEYGRTVAYGAATTPVSVGSGVVAVPVSAVVGGLVPSQEYHYRVVSS